MIREDYRAIARIAKEIQVAEALREVALKNLLTVTVRVGTESAVEKYKQSAAFEADAMNYCEEEGWVEYGSE
ncbi:hypothetical protein LCGC14_3059200 [marine sediment metagenome]|uniref:Uncharacterized protein n=1 Tax=marine sediment metagenome TaxID=412755 RepID=A0A0F8YS86_9ZZZZ